MKAPILTVDTKGRVREIPLEILRADPLRALPREGEAKEEGDAPIYGEIENEVASDLATPVQSFRVAGAVASYRNFTTSRNASSEFFFLRNQQSRPDLLNELNQRYSIFGYIVDGLPLVGQLGESAVIDRAVVRYGAEKITRDKKFSFFDLFSDDS